MPLRRIIGTAERERALRRERELQELKDWTMRRASQSRLGYTGRLGSHDDEVRRRWASYYKISSRTLRKIPRRALRMTHRGTQDPVPVTPPFSSSSDEDYEPPIITESDPFPNPEPAEVIVITAEEFASAFYPDGRPDSLSEFWDRQMGGTTEVWQSVGLMLENQEFLEVKPFKRSLFS